MDPDERDVLIKIIKRISNVLEMINEIKVMLKSELESDPRNDELRNIFTNLEKEEKESTAVLLEVKKLIRKQL
ncbi:hypothetical protein [Sporolactobacillus pectinivorans]|uniref:hypothetical protein n=1 Tax=Sporolactobacillus pectinivorans TaxID=1591408 RepID=UPI000C265806|nr:hypothetical protein [Sporolactobacillus pectinivorans]